MDRITVHVLLIEGTGAAANAHLRAETDPDNAIRVPAWMITQGTGYTVDELPGKNVLARVEDGELIGFEPA